MESNFEAKLLKISIVNCETVIVHFQNFACLPAGWKLADEVSIVDIVRYYLFKLWCQVLSGIMQILQIKQFGHNKSIIEATQNSAEPCTRNVSKTWFKNQITLQWMYSNNAVYYCLFKNLTMFFFLIFVNVRVSRIVGSIFQFFNMFFLSVICLI